MSGSKQPCNTNLATLEFGFVPRDSTGTEMQTNTTHSTISALLHNFRLISFQVSFKREETDYGSLSILQTTLLTHNSQFPSISSE
jgi:hypothetical protein